MARTIIFNFKDADTLNDIQTVAVDVLVHGTDVSIGSGVTDASGNFTSAAQAAGTKHYITASKTGYLPITKAGGLYFQKKLVWTSPTADETQAIEILLQADRARTQCVVYEGAGATSGAVQAPVAGAQVLIKKTSDNATIETLTTDADGVVYLDESSYTGVPYYVVVSKALYNSNTVHRGNYELGQSFAVPLQLTIAHTTKNFKLYLTDAGGTPIVGKALKMIIKGFFSVTDTGVEYYVPTGTQVTITTDANGLAETDFIENMLVGPAPGWASYFGFPEGVTWRMSADVVVGDMSAGLI